MKQAPPPLLSQSPPNASLQELSEHELELFALFGQGMTATEVAELLHLSRQSVELQRASLKEKLKLAASFRLEIPKIWRKSLMDGLLPPTHKIAQQFFLGYGVNWLARREMLLMCLTQDGCPPRDPESLDLFMAFSVWDIDHQIQKIAKLGKELCKLRAVWAKDPLHPVFQEEFDL